MRKVKMALVKLLDDNFFNFILFFFETYSEQEYQFIFCNWSSLGLLKYFARLIRLSKQKPCTYQKKFDSLIVIIEKMIIKRESLFFADKLLVLLFKLMLCPYQPRWQKNIAELLVTTEFPFFFVTMTV